MVELTRQERVGVLTLDDGKANAFRPENITLLQAALEEASADDQIGALVITGRPGFFSAGFDLKRIPSLPHAEKKAAVGGLLRAIWQVAGYAKPVVAAASGHAIAGGAILLMAADVRFGVSGPYRIGLNEVAIGIPLPGSLVELSRMTLAPQALSWAVACGRLFSPEEAVPVGFLHKVVAPEELRAAALAEADALSRLPSEAFRLTRTATRGAALARIHASWEAELDPFLDKLGG